MGESNGKISGTELGEQVRSEIREAIGYARQERERWDRRWAPALPDYTQREEQALIDEQQTGYQRILDENHAMPEPGADPRDVMTVLMFRNDELKQKVEHLELVNHNQWKCLRALASAVRAGSKDIPFVDWTELPPAA